MGKARMPKVDIRQQELEQTESEIFEYSDIVSRIVKRIVTDVIKDLDELIAEIQKELKQDRGKDLSDDDLNYFIAELPVLMYYVNVKMEEVGIKADASSAVRKERYDDLFIYATGTIPDKTSETNKQVKNETVVEAAYKRAYKQVQSRLDIAQILLNSLKKIINYRISSLDLNNSTSKVSRRRERNEVY